MFERGYPLEREFVVPARRAVIDRQRHCRLNERGTGRAHRPVPLPSGKPGTSQPVADFPTREELITAESG